MREYTQRDFDSARGAIEQLPDHLSISSESAPVCLGESVHRVLLASPNRSQVKALPLSLSFYSFLSLLSFVQFFFSSPLAWNRNSSARREKDREKNSAIISLSDHFATLSFRSIFLHRGTEYFPPWFRVFLSPFT